MHDFRFSYNIFGIHSRDGLIENCRRGERQGYHALRPVQRVGFGGYGPPLIVGGTGKRILRLAAETADIISVAGVFQVKGQPPGTLRLGTARRSRSARALRPRMRRRSCRRPRVAHPHSSGRGDR